MFSVNWKYLKNSESPRSNWKDEVKGKVRRHYSKVHHTQTQRAWHTYLDPILLWWEEPTLPGHWDGTAMAEAFVKNNCEDILKSFVFKFKNHYGERRNVYELTAN